MPSLRDSLRLELIRILRHHHVVGVEIRHTASSDGHAVDQHIQLEARVLPWIVARRLYQRHVFQQQHRIFDRIDIEGELNPLCLIIRIPVTEANGSQLAIRNGLRHTSGTRLCLRTVEMDCMTAAFLTGTVIHPFYSEIIEGIRAVRSGIIDIAYRIVQIQIIHTHLIRIIYQFGFNRLKAVEIRIANRADYEIRLADSEIGESSGSALHNLRTRPRLPVIGIGADFIVRGRTLPVKRNDSTVLGHCQIGRLLARRIVGDIDVIHHRTRLLCLLHSVCPGERQVMLRAVAFFARYLYRALLPGRRSIEIIHTGCGLQRHDIVLIERRHTTGRRVDRQHADRIVLSLIVLFRIILRNPQYIQTVKLTRYIRHHTIVECQQIIARDIIQRYRIIRKYPTTFIGIMRCCSVVVGYEEAVLTVSVIITRRSDIPFIRQRVVYTRGRCWIERPTGTVRRVLKITRIPSHCLNRHGQSQYRQEGYGE